jgi:uncharacterized membrane protein YdjX (TVP38/TMEM64 family)
VREKRSIPWMEIGITAGGCLLLAALVLAVPALRHASIAALHGDTSEVREQIKSLGGWGPVIIVTLGVIHSVVPYPAEIVNAAAGFAYGFFGGLAIVSIGWMLSAIICYWFGTGVARPVLDRWFGVARFERYEKMVERGGITLLLALRLLPIVPFSLISAAMGAARVPFPRYCWTTAVGFLPITALAVYFGTRLEGIRFTDPAVIAAIVGVVLLLLVGHLIIKRSGAAPDEPDGATSSSEPSDRSA